MGAGASTEIPADSKLPPAVQDEVKATFAAPAEAGGGEDAAKARYVAAATSLAWFQAIDVDSDGTIDQGELKRALKVISKGATRLEGEAHMGIQVVELMRRLSNGGAEPIIDAQSWIFGLEKDESSGLRAALAEAFDTATGRLKGLMTLAENMDCLDAEIAALELQLAKLKEKRAKMADKVDATQGAAAVPLTAPTE